ncbi:hypothetical protein FDG95_gp406 [Pectobacterium phage vB_PcaM_CBB]|uniref:Uncharacterized protein n=1 Tax=Pectobacterium phage vB_PcaM_CBB TaxID=2772511 RepID=A0A1L2CU83_9CAUD|nr:hypothetical protein FDG95_gp020 [Pectobacterium phage vB_PcaM_CBB]YP_009595113.1 hypothetical protein FDG95_gp406 [Pectobacterium phage vB_PcaM_CBB]AMM43585.1 hypothetical protein CBB_20 [Pectobacterium phage vB_PcaM_CBB]AMM44136.1 hypothetical protein CBB_573 [Pectobacterium phage vB_PcaM_CBB]
MIHDVVITLTVQSDNEVLTNDEIIKAMEEKLSLMKAEPQMVKELAESAEVFD